MIFLAITKVKNKLWTLVRVAFVLALLSLLVPPLFNLASQATSNSWTEDDPPTGQPMRVEEKHGAQEVNQDKTAKVQGEQGTTQGPGEIGEGTRQGEAVGVFEQFVVKLRQYYQEEN